MLEEVLRHLNNYFVAEVHSGIYTVEDGSITLPFLQNGQYFRILNSVFNEGVYQYPASALTEETFEGIIWALAVPKAVVELSEEIQKWQEEYGAKINSPYTSESFGGYSYTKSSSGTTGASINSWQDAFRGRLNQWRKMKFYNVARPNQHMTPPLPCESNPWR